MNYAGKFGSGGLDSSSAAHLDLDSLSHRINGDPVTVPDAHLLFSGDFARSGRDLIISDAAHRFVVQNYFDVHKRPALVSPDGAPLDPRVVDALTGHVAYAQAGGAPAAKVVGNVVKMTGSASVVRNGVTVVLNNGDAIYQGDVVQTGSGSTLGLVLLDGTAFNLTANARLMLNDLTYDANSSSNSSLLTLVQGAASFVAGQVAKTGDMKVATPVATMGIRGTAVILDISAIDGKVSVSVMDQGDGQTHMVQVYTPNAAGNLVLIGTVTSTGGGLTLTPTATFEVIAEATNKTPAQIAQEFNAFQALLTTYDAGKQLIPSLPQHTENKGGGDKDTSPATTTKYASSAPANPTAPEYHPPTGSPTVTPSNTQTAQVVVTTSSGGSGGGGAPPSGTPATDSTPPPVTKTVTFTPIPFVVTPAIVASITPGGGDHTGPVMSASGNVVYDPDGIVYFYDRQSQSTIRVSSDDGLVYSGQTISSDGRYIVYQGTDGTNTYVFVYGTDPADTAHYHQQTQLVAGTSPAISGDGSAILVEQGGAIGIYDLQGHIIATITPASSGVAGTLWKPSISADGHVVTFWSSSTAGPGGAGHLYAYNVSTGVATDVVSLASGAGNHAASISADGHYIVYQGLASGGQSQIYLYDLDTHQVVFSTANAAGASRNPVISPDGHYIIFTSDAQLTGSDQDGSADTYMVDVTNPAAPVFRLVSELNSTASDGGVAISAGGLYTAFASGAPGSSSIFFADPTSGRSGFIRESVNSPAQLETSGKITLTGDLTGVTITTTDPSGHFTVDPTLDANGNITWHFSQPKSDFASLQPGQIAIQDFTITLGNSSGGTTTIPVRVSVYDADQPAVAIVTNPGSIIGGSGNDALNGTPANDVFQGFGGDDTITGLSGVDRAVYTDATGGITANLSFTGSVAQGTVTGPGVGADTLVGVEAIQGSNFVDHYTATGFNSNPGVPGVPLGHNIFEGMAGDDIITGGINGQGQKTTRISYASSTGAVTVNLGTGDATGNASVGHDHFTNVNGVTGSSYGDTLIGSDNLLVGSYEFYDGRSGNDFIDGRSGYDLVVYNNDPATRSGITVDMAVGTVTGDASIGQDTLRNVEGVRGTNYNDVYHAEHFGMAGYLNPASNNVGSSGTFNNFEGAGGDDTIYGNGNTRLQYTNATAGVTVNLSLGKAFGTAPGDIANVGTDTFTGVNAVYSSMFDDILIGDGNNNNFQANAGNDSISGGGGFDIAQYNNIVFVTGGITVDMAAGTVTGDLSIGTDTLKSIEAVQGTGFDDTYNATNYMKPGYTNPAINNVGNNGTFNQFEGVGGDDQITGNGNTKVGYFNATAAVTVDLADTSTGGTGTAQASDVDAGIGVDTFHDGISGIGGSAFGDTLLGSNNASGVEQFEGRAGDDLIDGRGGYDQATYNTDGSVTGGIIVTMSGTGGTVDGDGSVGDDTLVSIESVIGTRFADSYNAQLFSGFNEFQGVGGNDSITGNGFTQIGYFSATAGIIVDLQDTSTGGTGTAKSIVADTAGIGLDTIHGGVNSVQGSNFADTLLGTTANEFFGGQNGNDLIDGRGGGDFMMGNAGSDTFVYSLGYGNAVVGDFSHGEADRIDLSGVPDVHSLGDLQMSQIGPTGADTLIQFSDGGSLVLSNVNHTSLVASDFIFAPLNNHAPAVTLGAGDSGAATLPEINSAPAATGTLSISDTDGTDQVNVSVSGVQHTGPTGGLSDATLLSYFTVPLAPVLFSGQTSGHFSWLFDTQGQTFDYLKAGETLSLTYTITPDDGHPPAGTGFYAVAITINGSNDAPTLNSAALESILEDTAAGSIAGVSVAELFGAQFSDVDGTMVGIAVSGNSATPDQGVWQYQNTETGVWEDIGSPDPEHALAFTNDTLLRFVPAQDFNGTPGSLEVHAIDDSFDEEFTVGSDPDPGGERYTINITDDGYEPLGHGGTSPISYAAVSLTTFVTPVNDAPVFTGESLGSISTGGANVAIVANVVAEDVDSDNYSDGSLTATITDGGNSGDTLRISDTGYITLQGNTVLYDSSGNGLSYVAIGTLTDNINSLTIDLNGSADDAAVARLTSAISFENSMPAPEAGTRTVTFTLQDGGGTAHGAHDSTYFTADVTIPGAPVNQAPVLKAFTFTLDPAGAYVFAAVAGHYSDADGDGFAGLAISSIDADAGAEGVWQIYAGGQWTTIDPDQLSETHALAVNYATQLRFVPEESDHVDRLSITAYALDSNLGQNSGNGDPVYIDVKTHGGSTHISDPAIISVPTITNEDTPVFLLLEAGGATQPTIIVGPAHGTFAFNPDGSVIYTPDQDFNGTDTFTYTHSTTQTTNNLIVNPGGEFGPSVNSADFGPVPQGWTLQSGYFTVVDYGAPGFGLDGTAIGGGHAFFSGGPASVASSISQMIDVGSYSADINAGAMTANLSGYLGGWFTDDDNITVTVHFLDTGNTDLGNELDIGPVLAGDRAFATSLLYVSDSIAVPVGTQHITVTVTSTKTAGSYNDGYADNLSLTLSHGGEQSEPTVVTITVNPVNDTPIFDCNIVGEVSEGGLSVAIATDVYAIDVDSDNYGGGSLKIEIDAPGSFDGDLLSIVNNADIELSDDDIYYQGNHIGALSGATTDRSLVISLDSGATDEAVAALSEAVQFSSTSGEAGNRNIIFTLTDGGGAPGWFQVNVEVTGPAANHAPTVDDTSWINRVSVNDAGVEGNAQSFNGAISSTGVAVFSSDADNLVDDDSNDEVDIFIHDLRHGTTERVNVDSNGNESNLGSLDGPSISADGNFVVFQSSADNLVPGDNNNVGTIYLHNVSDGTTEMVSVDESGDQLGSESLISNHAISDNGRYVVFETEWSASIYDQNDAWDIYVRDTVSDTTTLVSAYNLGPNPGSDASNYAVISGDGRFVAFNSAVDGLDATGLDSNGFRDVYVRDLLAETTRLASDPDGGHGDSVAYAISGDGRYVLYTAEYTDGSDRLDLILHDMQSGDLSQGAIVATVDATYFTTADISADGRHVVYTNTTPEGGIGVYVFDAATHITMLVSTNVFGDAGESTSEYPAISANGRFITFQSNDGNFDPGDSNDVTDVFVVDLAAPTRVIHDTTGGSTLGVFGLVAFSDEDLLDTHGSSFLPVYDYPTANFEIDPPIAGVDGHGTVHWSFQIDHAAVAYLAEGEEATFSYNVFIDDGTDDDSQTIEITVVGVNDAASVDLDENESGLGHTGTLYVGGDPVAISAGAQVTDADSNYISSATVVLASGWMAGDYFTVGGSSGPSGFFNDIQWEITGDGGVDSPLTITFFSGGTPADYSDAIAAVSFGSNGTTEHSVDIAVTVDDGDKLSSPVISHIDVVASTDNVWTGAASNDWNLPDNWSLGRIPTSADNVTINDAMVQVEIADDQYSINQLTLASPGIGQLELDISGTSSGGFTVGSALSNEGTILVQYTNFNAPGTVLNHGVIEAAGQNSVLNFVSATIDHADGEGELVASAAGKISLIDTTVDTGSIEVYDESQVYISGSTLAGVDLITLGSGIVTIAATAGVGSSTTAFDGSDELFLNEANVNVDSGATLTLLGSIDNQGGGIQVGAGAEVRFSDATVQGGEIGAYGAQAHIVMQGSTFVEFDLAAGYGGYVTIAAAPSGQSSITTFNNTTIEEGDIVIEAGATLNLVGYLSQYGTITVDPAMQPGTITVTDEVSLSGGGTIVLEDPNGSVITSAPGQTGTLSIDDDNTISGTGQLGGGNLNIIINSGSAQIVADNAETGLFINTGSGTLYNHGHITSDAAGGIDIAGDIESDGFLVANAGLFEIHGEMTGGGSAYISAGTMKFDAASDAVVDFNPLDFHTGTLVLGDIEHFTGMIDGFTYGDTIHVIGHAANTLLETNVSTGEVLLRWGTGPDDHISLGNYLPGAFTLASDTSTGTNVIYNQLATTSDAQVTSLTYGVGTSLPGTAATGLAGVVVIGISTDGVNFEPVTEEAGASVEGTYLNFTAQRDGSVGWNVGVTGYPNAPSLIAAIEGNETGAEPLTDRFYYKVQDGNGKVWIDHVDYNLTDFTFGGVGERTLGVAHGEFLSLGELSVHDWGYQQEDFGISPLSVTVTVGFGELSLVNGLPAGDAMVTYSTDHSGITINGSQTDINDTLNALQFTSATAGHTDILISGIDGPVHSATYYAGTIAVDDVAPAALGDMSVITAIGHSVALTTADLNVNDPDDPDHTDLIFTIVESGHGHLRYAVDWIALGPGDHFTLADIEAGLIFYQSPADYTGQDHIRLRLSDNVSGAPEVFVNLGATVVDAQLTVLTTDGYDFVGEDPAIVMGDGIVVPDANDPNASFTIINIDEGRKFVYTGVGFEYGPDNVLTGGRVVSITEMDLADHPQARLDINVDAAAWYAAIVAKANGDNSPLEALAQGWTFSFIGNSGSDAFDGGDFNDYFSGKAGDDTFLGHFGYDRAGYFNATSGITVNLAAGTVTGASAGTDTLDSIEMVSGTNHDDSFDATGFSATSHNAGSTVANNVNGTFNEFEGLGGTDTITGNGSTRISYYHATAGVTVIFNQATSWTTQTSGASGIATGNDSVGTDHFSGVNSARLSFFDDTVTGSTNPLGTSENFEGLGGDDAIDGGGGFDRAVYNHATDGVGIDVQLAAGIVTGGVDTGTDTLLSIEGIWGTEYADVYDATGFTAADVPSPSANAGTVQNQANPAVLTNFNEFEGGGGNDTITGTSNGNTRIAFYHATSGVMVELGYGATHGIAIGSSIGQDDIVGGVNRVRLSEFNDIIVGSISNEVFEGQGGNDALQTGGGNDLFTGGTGADAFVFDAVGGLAAVGNVLTVTDFHGHGSEGDRIDLRNLPGITSFSQLVFNDFSGNAEITFGPGNLAKIVLIGVNSSSLNASDFIIGNQVNVQVQTPDGYDFGTLYDDMAGSALQPARDSEHMLVYNAASGITFELIGTGFTYSGGVPTGGTINEIHILEGNIADFTDLATIHDHTLVDSDGWAISAPGLFGAVGAYASSNPGTHASGLASLNTIFNSARYSVAGASNFVTTDTLGHSGNDVLFGGDNADTFVGLSGNDTVDYSHATGAVTASLATPASNTGAAAGDLYNGIENLRATDYADTLTGNGNNNVLEGGPGGDALVGGGGADTASYEHAAASVYVDLDTPGNNTGDAASDSYNSIENILGSSYDDTLVGNGGDNTIEGGAGNDIITGGAGNNTASYEHATAGVFVNLSFTSAQNTGGAGNDTLSQIQNLNGSRYNDALVGNSGDNLLIGMGGNDTFVFNIEAAGGIGHDTIGDFSPGEDHILLDDAVFDASGPNDFSHWIATHAAAQNSGQDTLIDFDPLGHPGEQTLLLKNVAIANLHASDFILQAGGLTA